MPSRENQLQAARSRQNRKAYLAAGLCLLCGEVPPASGRKQCDPCKEKTNQYRRNRLQRLLATGACGKCGKNQREGEKFSCVPCGVKNAAKKKLNYIAARDRGRAKGLCNQCGNRPRKDGFLRCVQCVTNGTVARFKKYGLTHEKFAKLGDACRICDARRDLVIDHNHETGEVRGVLCRLCNAAVGMLRDSPELLIKAAEYLRATASAVVSQIDQPTGDGRATGAEPRYLN